MKKRNLLPGFALALLMMLGVTGTARATDYLSCSDFNNNIPTAPSGDVSITNSGSCSLNAVSVSNAFTVSSTGAITASSISAAGEVHLEGTSITASGTVESTGNRLYIKATSGDVDAQAITAHGEYIQVLAPAGKITINGVVTGTNLTEIFKARDDVGLKAGATNNGGDIRVFAHTSGTSSTAFAIGSSTANGASFINTNGSTGGTIYISNGTSTGGINYSGSASFKFVPPLDRRERSF